MRSHRIQLDQVYDNKQRETHHTHSQPLHLLTYKIEKIHRNQFHNIPDHLQAIFSSVDYASVVSVELDGMETKTEIFVH